jgi:SAM-dependent methyltransferase
MGHRDYFSDHSKIYAAFRPTYPDELYQFILKHVRHRDCAWDCATGNGQAARHLSRYFKTVFATDISRQQLDQAPEDPNILYSISAAEQTGFADKQFDLITVAQALHWFEVESFYKEARRTSKDHGLLAVWGYALLSVSPEIDRRFLDFYHGTVGPYWDYARTLVENEYRSIPFPFEQIESPPFELVATWGIEQLGGYLTSWSATREFIRQNGHDPVPAFLETIEPYWQKHAVKKITFPLFLKLGRIHSGN